MDVESDLSAEVLSSLEVTNDHFVKALEVCMYACMCTLYMCFYVFVHIEARAPTRKVHYISAVLELVLLLLSPFLCVLCVGRPLCFCFPALCSPCVLCFCLGWDGMYIHTYVVALIKQRRSDPRLLCCWGK